MQSFTRQKQALLVQLLQLLDAGLVWLGWWLAATIAGFGGDAPGPSMLTRMSWVLYIAVPFTPLVLELFGFYRNIRGRSQGKAMLQVTSALGLLGVVLCFLAVFAPLPEGGPLIACLAAPLTGFLLFVRDRVTPLFP